MRKLSRREKIALEKLEKIITEEDRKNLTDKQLVVISDSDDTYEIKNNRSGVDTASNTIIKNAKVQLGGI